MHPGDHAKKRGRSLVYYIVLSLLKYVMTAYSNTVCTLIFVGFKVVTQIDAVATVTFGSGKMWCLFKGVY